MSVKCPECQFENTSDSKFCKECGTQILSVKDIDITETMETPKEELTTGSTFAGRYQIIEELGRGGMGKVYKALDAEVNEKVALKLIKPEIAADKKTIDRFRNELKFARKIRHKNVCQMYDLGAAEGAYFITMEYVSGEDLKKLIRKMGFLSPGQAISIAKQVCDGLVEAHKLGVVHRDLKPQNIMVDEEGDARIMDFGVARSIEGKSITGAGVMIGTPDYMSPEQVDGKDIDQRSDIYSLGIILYEMVTGQTPFEGDTPFTIGVKHKSETPKNPKELNSQISDDLSRVILRCLEKDKDDRYQSAGEVRSELINIKKGIPTTERIIPERKPLTSREITVQVSMKKLFIPALIVLVIVLVAVLIWQFFPREAAVSFSTEKPSLAIMYFENNTGDQNLDHWRKALSELLTADLSQSKYLAVMSGDRLYNILNDLNLLDAQSYSSEDLEEVGSRGGVENIVRGSYTKAGDNFRINIMLQKVKTGELIGSERIEGTGEESMFTMVDELTKRIKENFELSTEEISSDLDEEVGKITTSSPEAYKYYSEGRRYHTIGENRKSIELMERAIAIDPQFAMAYRSISVSYQNLLLFAERNKYSEKALELVDRLSERERYIIEGGYYSDSETTFDKAIEAYTKLLDLYPDDTIVNHNLAVIYGYIEDYDKAIERYEVCTQAGEEFIHSHTQLADSYAAKGLYDKAKEILKNYIDNISDHVLAHHGLAYLHIDLGEWDQALAETEKAIYLDPTHYENLAIKGDIYCYKGEFLKAEEEFRKMIQSTEPAGQSLGFVHMINLKILQGKFDEATKLCKKGIELSQKLGQKSWESRWRLEAAQFYLQSGNLEEVIKECDEASRVAEEIGFLHGQRRALCYKGLALLKMGSVEEARKAASDLKVMIEQGLRKKAIRLYFHLAGVLEVEAGNYSKAVQYLNDAISLAPYGPLAKHAAFIDSLALAYYKLGDLEKALREYERITTLTTGRDQYGGIYAKSFYMLGNIHEEKGDAANAIENYEKFLDLWKDADPGMAEVEDAQKRLAGLKSQSMP